MSKATATRPAADVAEIKRTAAGRWPAILAALAGIPADRLDGRHGPCPKCGGTDRFRALDDFRDTGAVFCNQCFSQGNGDGLAALQHFGDVDFPTAARMVADYLGTTANGNGKAHTTNGKRREIAAYDYRDQSGERLYQVVRFEPKDFRQRAPKPEGGWSWTIKGISQVPYRLPELLAADPVTIVFIVEGEKDVDNLAERGLVGTCNAMGAGKWRKAFADYLRGRHVAVLPDNDEPGRKHGGDVARSLAGKAASIKVVELAGLPEKGDVSDWLANGGTVAELLRLVDAAPEWTPAAETNDNPSPSEQSADQDQLWNATVETQDDGDEKKLVVIPRPMAEIIGYVFRRTDGQLRRIEKSLFAHAAGQAIDWLDSPAALFGFLQTSCGIIQWRKGPGFVAKEELFCELRRQAPCYTAVENLPHFPPVPAHYYACPIPAAGDGRALAELIKFHCLETDLDCELAAACFATGIWGGPGGTRPAFLITAPAGRGMGKTKFAQHLARLYGGVLDISPQEDIGAIKQRFLSPEAAGKRIATLDNLKTTRFSWAEFENQITADVINGKKMYVGDGTRPNLITWTITLNGASLSTDMAQRVVEIRLREPRYNDTWEERVAGFIDANRDKIIADCIGFLQRPAKAMRRHSRWATWEAAILSRCEHPDQCLDLILDRRGAVDVEAEESEIIEDAFAGKLAWLEYDPDTADVFIPNDLAARWFNQATGDNKRVTGVTRTLKQLADESKIHRLTPDRSSDRKERGFRWIGEHADSLCPTDYTIRARIKERDKTT